MDTLMGIVKNICAFIILTTVVNNLLQESSYRKYIRYFSGLVIIMMIIEPVTYFWELDIELQEAVNEYISVSERDELYEEIMMGEYIADNDINKKYRQSLDESLDVLLKKHDMKYVDSEWQFNDELSEDDYGRVKGLYVQMEAKDDVDISQLTMDEQGRVGLNKVEEDVKEDINAMFGIEKGMIRVEILI